MNDYWSGILQFLTETANTLSGYLVSGFMTDAYLAIQAFFIIYVFVYNTVTFVLMLLAFIAVRAHLKGYHVTDEELLYHSPHAPVVSILVPAFNEAKTIVQSIRSLLRQYYPSFEIVIINDGSNDGTLDILKNAFKLIRKDSEYSPILRTARVKGLYESGSEKPANVFRVLVIDKDNGGKADSINAGVNAARGDFICTIDADSILETKALIQVAQPVIERPGQVVASGGQVAIANGCRIGDGRVHSIGLPGRMLPMFQVAEYIRAFTGGRTAFAAVNSLLVLSGAFALIQRKILIEVGGFLTSNMNTRIGLEYCGKINHTVCEDMEIIVRIWRYLFDLGEKKEVAFFPHPICWTEVPESWKSLGRQRNRWFRGLCEILVMHRIMLFNPKYGRLGMFALPYQLMFEFLGPMLEFTGYILLPLLWLSGYLDVGFLWLYFLTATVYGVFISFASVLLGLWNEQAPGRWEKNTSLFRYIGFRDKIKLFFFSALSLIGYRQIVLFHMIRGFVDFLRGEKGWKKFERKGFEDIGEEIPRMREVLSQ